jgi:hypothetical protein
MDGMNKKLIDRVTTLEENQELMLEAIDKLFRIIKGEYEKK